MDYKRYHDLVIQKASLLSVSQDYHDQAAFNTSLANLYKERADEIESTLTEMDFELAKLQNGSKLRYQVFKMFTIEEIPLIEVAYRLGISYNYVRKISHEVKKEMKK